MISPMEDALSLMYGIGQASIITTLDLLKGYWAIFMKEEEGHDFTSLRHTVDSTNLK